MEKIRLDRFLSNQTEWTRTEAKAAIRNGRVRVNGKTVRDGGQVLSPQNDTVTLDGQAVTYKKYIYILLYKPAGVLSACEDARRETVVDLIDPALRRNGLAPVGRLDRDTTGLLLLTDDGDFAHRVISPKSGIPKRYLATLDGEIDDSMIAAFKSGVTLADGTVCRPAVLERAGDRQAYLTLTEGKYHEVKRMFGTVGLGVNALHREAVGALCLPEKMTSGEWKELTAEEAKSVFLEKSYTI